MAEENLDFSVNSEWKEFMKKNLWAAFIPEFAKNSNGQEFMRNHGSSTAYRIISEDKSGKQLYECANCSSPVMAAKVAHPIWDGPISGSGSGECRYEQVPYCPKCETVPDFNGSPISVGSKIR